MKSLLLGSVVASVLAGAAFAQTAASPQDFVSKASVSNRFEIDTSRAALERSSNDTIKRFAQQMIDDHTKASDELTATLAKAGLTAPAADLDPEHKAALDGLQAKTDAEFDRTYVLEQQKAHDEAVTLFSTFARSGEQADLKAFAAKTLPTLKMHQEHVNTLATADASAGAPAAGAPAATGAPASTGTASGTADAAAEGANSFTQAQAQQRLTDAGYTGVSGLAKDDRGVWRGKAMKDGASVDVGLDFKGNIVSK